MGILDEDVAHVRETTDLVAVAGDHIALKRVGQRWMGLCPFHQEKSPSFSINPALNLFYCFGCQKSGDAITFVREVEHLDFVEAVERLAQRAGITLRYDDRRTGQDRSRKTRLAEAVGAAIDFYHRRLNESPDGGAARKYLRGRGFDGDAARRFQLGWAPDDWDLLSRHLDQRGFARDDIEGAGLAFVNRANRLQDQFRSRLMFPIYDARGEPAGFGGRTLGDDQPKYKNSPETAIYHKSRLLYGLNWAKGEIVARGDVIICEGYTDVMGFALAGAPNAVATCGTALADDHFQVLKNLARRVTLAYDADAAGQGAAERWYRWEQEYEIQLRVADLPPGHDPGDLWQHDQPRLLLALEHAEPFLQFRLDRAIAGADLATIEGRARAATTAATIIAEHPNELVRDQYVMKLAGALDIDADRLRDAVTQARRAPRRPSREPPSDTPPPEPRRRPNVDRRELDLLRWAIHEPELIADWLNETLLQDPLARAAYHRLANSPSFADALDGTDDDVRALLERLAVEEPEADDEPETLRARLLVINVEPVAKRTLTTLLAAGDEERAGALKRNLDELVHAREIGEWERAEELGRRTLQWIVSSPE
ncbi:MAG TPA: DNA primase [Acidimicrobiia bacterium]